MTRADVILVAVSNSFFEAPVIAHPPSCACAIILGLRRADTTKNKACRKGPVEEEAGCLPSPGSWAHVRTRTNTNPGDVRQSIVGAAETKKSKFYLHDFVVLLSLCSQWGWKERNQPQPEGKRPAWSVVRGFSPKTFFFKKNLISLMNTMNTARKLRLHTKTDRGTCPGVGL